MKNDFPIDPVLPDNFDCTPNENRSKEELNAWWDRPFAITNENGTYSVRCLHGGAWDRSSWLSDAATIEEAKEVGTRMLTEWQSIRARPMFAAYEGAIRIIRMPQRPDMEEELLGNFK